MQTYIGIIIIAIFAGLTLGQPDRPPPPTNCTKAFDHSYSLDELLEEFRDDDIRNNMRKAARVFWSHPELTIEYMYDALNHEDWQVRQIMCKAIWDQNGMPKHYGELPLNTDWFQPNPQYPITRDLIRVTIEGLKNDTTPYNRPKRRALVYTNAKLGTIALISVAHLWISELEEAMESDDGQQRYLAAFILARAGIAQSVERASAILLPHLRDNDIRSDANFSVFALAGFGTELKPILQKTLPIADEQQRDLIMLLLWNIRDPAITKTEQIKRSKFNSITRNRHDPSQAPSRDVWNSIDHFETD